MDRVRLQLGADVAHAKGLYGNGIGVAVLDSGILPHPDFIEKKNRITAFVDFTEKESELQFLTAGFCRIRILYGTVTGFINL